jgi:hypothetical protein
MKNTFSNQRPVLKLTSAGIMAELMREFLADEGTELTATAPYNPISNRLPNVLSHINEYGKSLHVKIELGS